MAVILVMASLGAALLWWQHEQPVQQAPVPAPQANGWPLTGAEDKGLAQAAGSVQAVGDVRPADFSEEDWAALNRALAHEPNQAQERARLVSYLRFQRSVATWRQMQDGPATAERQALAREVVAQVPDHVAKREVNAGEALMVLNAMAADIEPDTTRRTAWLADQQKRLQATQTEAEASALKAEKQKNEDFARQQAEIVAQWESTPVANRDPVTLERQLQLLRDKVYGSTPN